MALVQRLDLRHSQQLVMTPQLQQAIKLLQLSNVELSAFVDQELERNPLLERDEAEAPRTAAAAEGPNASGSGTTGPDAGGSNAAGQAVEPPSWMDAAPPTLAPDRSGVDRLTDRAADGFGEAAPLDTDYENVWSSAGAADQAAEAAFDRPEPLAEPIPSAEGSLGPGFNGDDLAGSPAWGAGGRSGFDGPDTDWDQRLPADTTLRDHLLAQIAVEFPDPRERFLAGHLVDHLDESGYLATPAEEIAGALSLPEERVLALLPRLRRLDPVGVFARTLAECLAAQLAERDRLDPAMQALLDHLPMLAERKLKDLMRICGVDAEDMSEMIAEIRALDPKPGSGFGSPPAQTVMPDILMRSLPAGGWAVELNAETLPSVLVNQRYYAEVTAGARDKTEREYLAEAYQTANWLVKSLHQRAGTILKVAAEIVRQQDGFFVRGIVGLRPLILRDIAEAIGMHESTVSRVTSNKFIATPRGVFELKYFFTSSVGGANGDTYSAEAVRYRIKGLIDAETRDAVLSDDRIVELLRGEGIDIARRTVAKYREAMKIPSSVQRRRQMAAGL